ncbi:MAG TPA: hypothetical protein VEG32_14345 [Clostridia bacterium]|nr:hypothetical protein [Clostridia bacterium]
MKDLNFGKIVAILVVSYLAWAPRFVYPIFDGVWNSVFGKR